MMQHICENSGFYSSMMQNMCENNGFYSSMAQNTCENSWFYSSMMQNNVETVGCNGWMAGWVDKRLDAISLDGRLHGFEEWLAGWMV